jgi:hypothetical protein
MNTKTTILTHFSVPSWPVVNKLSAICKCLDVNMIHCSTVEKLKATIKDKNLGRVLYFTDEGMAELVIEIEKMKLPRFEIAMLVISPIPDLLEKLTGLSIVKYLIGLESPEFCGRDLSILIKKFSGGNILDLDKYLAFGCKIHSRTIKENENKREAIQSVADYVSKLGDPGYNHPFHEYSTRMAELIDELLLNAIFDANPRLNGADRSKPFQLSDKELVQVSWGYDGEYFGISVRDPFGKFQSETILKYLGQSRSFTDLTTSKSGGLGLKLIFEKAHQVIANVQHEQVTEVIALVKFANRLREFEEQKKSFYYFG